MPKTITITDEQLKRIVRAEVHAETAPLLLAFRQMSADFKLLLEAEQNRNVVVATIARDREISDDRLIAATTAPRKRRAG